MKNSVILCTHNPHEKFFRRMLFIITFIGRQWLQLFVHQIKFLHDLAQNR